MVMFVVGAPRSVHDFVNLSPVREPPEVAVVDVHVGHQFRGSGFVRESEAPGRGVAVDGVKREAAVLAEADRIFQQLAFAGGPEDDLVSFAREPAQGIDGKGFFPADFRVLVFYDGPVKIYCDNHYFSSFSPYP